uniref:DENN domain-containing protein 1B-like n=1 Tax=Myxine glutinosa TaxID=7769 RepID=UPI00358F6A18
MEWKTELSTEKYISGGVNNLPTCHHYNFCSQEGLENVLRFCFPFDVNRVSSGLVGQNFTFVLTDLDGKQRFGFCRLSSFSRCCLCFLSYLPWFETFYKLLNNVSDHFAKSQEHDVIRFLQALYQHAVPECGSSVSLSVGPRLNVGPRQVVCDARRHGSCKEIIEAPSSSYFIAPDTRSLPTIPESRNLTEYFVAVDICNIVHLYASLLCERRVLITCSKLSMLTACVHAAAILLYPMHWQHIYIPVLPPHLIDYCGAPMPYLIGIHSSLMERVREMPLEEVVTLNVDTNVLHSPFDDLAALPHDVVSSLKSRLKRQSTETGDGVARAFLRTQASLFGGYREALRFVPGQPITFCDKAFVEHKSVSARSFLQNATQLQLFKQFIEDRLQLLNSGVGFSDVFEEEIDHGGYGKGSSKSYQLWLLSVKKSSGALLNSMKTRANPAMKTMYKFAKDHAKQGFKEVKNLLKQKDVESEYVEDGTDCLQSGTLGRPARRHASDTQNRRPLTNLNPQMYLHRPAAMRRPQNHLTQEFLLGSDAAPISTRPERPSSEEDPAFSPLPTMEFDLLSEIYDSLPISNIEPPGLLMPSRSLNTLLDAGTSCSQSHYQRFSDMNTRLKAPWKQQAFPDSIRQGNADMEIKLPRSPLCNVRKNVSLQTSTNEQFDDALNDGFDSTTEESEQDLDVSVSVECEQDMRDGTAGSYETDNLSEKTFFRSTGTSYSISEVLIPENGSRAFASKNLQSGRSRGVPQVTTVLASLCVTPENDSRSLASESLQSGRSRGASQVTAASASLRVSAAAPGTVHELCKHYSK